MEKIRDILEKMPEELVNIIIQYTNEYTYEKEGELELEWPEITDMKIHKKILYVPQYYLGNYKKLECWNIEINEKNTEIPNDSRYDNKLIKNIDFIDNNVYICTNKNVIYMFFKMMYIFPHTIYYNTNIEIKKIIITNDFMVIQKKDWGIERMKYGKGWALKYKGTEKNPNYDFYVYENKIYLLSMYNKKILIYSMKKFLLKEIKIINNKKLRDYNSEEIRMLIKDDMIYVNNGRKLLILDMDGEYISEINYNKYENMNLPFCVNDGKVYLSVKNKIMIYKQKYKSKDVMTKKKSIGWGIAKYLKK